MVDPDHAALSLTCQCCLVSIAPSSWYDEGTGESPLNQQQLRRIDEQFLETPFYGARQMTRWLRRQETWGQPHASPAPAAARGPAGDLPTAPDVSVAPGAPDPPMPAARPGDHAAESGVVCGRAVHSAGARRALPGRGRAGRSSPGGCPTRSTPASVSQPCPRRSTAPGPPRSSRPTRAATARVWPAPTCARTLGSTAQWTARATGWSTPASSGCGVRSNMSRSVWLSTPPPQRPGRASAGGSMSTTNGGRTRRSGTGRPPRCTLWGVL